MSLLAFRMIILSPMLESTTFTIFIMASYLFRVAWFAKRPRQTFHFCNGHSSFEASINRQGGPAICNTYSLRIPAWRQYWSALMLVTTLPWYSTNLSIFLNECKSIKPSKKESQNYCFRKMKFYRYDIFIESLKL